MSFRLSALILFILTLNVLLTWSYLAGMTALTKENGLLENAQLLLLFAAVISITVKWSILNNDWFRFLLWGAGLLAISFFLRELDLRRTNLNSWLIFFTSEQGRTWLTILLWIPFFWFVTRNTRLSIKSMARFVKTHSFWIYMLAALTLVIGAIFDKNLVVTQHKHFFEEILELNGYAIFLVATRTLGKSLFGPLEPRCTNDGLQLCTGTS